MAFDAEAVRLDCGNAAATVVGEEILAGEICPLAKASFGSFLQKDSIARTCDLLVLPTSCDAKRKMGEVLNDFVPTFMFNLPSEQNHARYSKSSLLEVFRLIDFLKTHTGRRFSNRRLKEAIGLGLRRTHLVRELFDLRSKDPLSMSIRDLFLIIQSALFRPVDPEDWIKEATTVLEELKSRDPAGKSLRPRFVLTGAPIVWPNYKVLNIIEESGADIVADTLCTGVQSCFDPVVVDERGRRAMLRALVNRYIFASICPCYISQTTRINRILDLVDTTDADGVISYSLRLCQLFDVENYRVTKILKAGKIHHINIRTDYSLEDTEQLRIRIEAFLETL
jgi:benzoyl-CoA reductase/2-hydroxyglutaryl-CoA dehydratase subunit BcrC/BadD/HgdB